MILICRKEIQQTGNGQTFHTVHKHEVFIGDSGDSMHDRFDFTGVEDNQQLNVVKNEERQQENNVNLPGLQTLLNDVTFDQYNIPMTDCRTQ